ISGAADEPGNILREGVQNFAGAFARGHALGIGGEVGEIFVPAVGQGVLLHFIQTSGELGEFFRIFGEEGVPLGALFVAAGTDAVLEILVDTVGDEELGVFGPAVILFREFYFGFSEWFAVGFVGILLVRGAVADVAVNDDQSGLVGG